MGRAQVAIAVAPYLGVLATPVAFVVELLGAVGLLFYATRLEYHRENEEADSLTLGESHSKRR